MNNSIRKEFAVQINILYFYFSLGFYFSAGYLYCKKIYESFSNEFYRLLYSPA